MHPVDQEVEVCRKALGGNPDVFSRMKDFDLDEDLEFLAKGVAKKKPMAAFLSLSITQIGLSIPEICQRGFDHLSVLANARRCDQVVEVLNNLIPLFFSEPKGLVEEKGFMDVVSLVMGADHSIVAYAKTLAYKKEPGPMLKEFESMICKQIKSYAR